MTGDLTERTARTELRKVMAGRTTVGERAIANKVLARSRSGAGLSASSTAMANAADTISRAK